MAFPESPLPIKHEILIDGTWTDITTKTRESDNVVIKKGYTGETSSLSSDSCTFKLSNPDAFFSNRSPYSVNYGKLGRNIRHRVATTEVINYMALDDASENEDFSTWDDRYSSGFAWTADKASLDITGDIDVRADINPDLWYGNGNRILASKAEDGSNNISWIFCVTSAGFLSFSWSSAGSVADHLIVSTVAVPVVSGRLAIRVTLDVNNGASGNTVTFYTASAIGGTYTQLGTSIITAGTTSIFSSSVNLIVGSSYDIRDNNLPFVGKYYSFELRTGIAGTLVAKADFTSRSPGDTSWSDGLTSPNTWSLIDTFNTRSQGTARIDNVDYRFHGEIATLPTEWDSTGTDVYARTISNDILRRMTQGAKALKSTIYRAINSNIPLGSIVGWWPLEDTGNTGQFLSAVKGKQGATLAGAFTTDPLIPGAASVLTFSDDTGRATGNIGSMAPITGEAEASFYFTLGTATPSGSPTFMYIYFVGGSVYRVALQATATNWVVTILGRDGSTLLTSSTAFGAATPDKWCTFTIGLSNSGSNLSYNWIILPVGEAVGAGALSSISTASIGCPSGWLSEGFTSKSTMRLSHVVLSTDSGELDRSDLNLYAQAYNGETAPNRFARLCTESEVPWWLVGNVVGLNPNLTFNSVDGRLMGPQLPDTLVNLLQSCATVDGGYLFTPRNKFGLSFRLYNSIINQPGTELDYSQKVLSGSLAPIEDDSFIRNDVTVSRPGGGSARVVRDSGSLNVNDSADDPNGVGTYDIEPSRNLYSDDQLEAAAGYEVFQGTWDELRYPSVQVNLSRSVYVSNASHTAAVRRLDLFSPILLSNLPTWLPPDDVSLLIIGYTETLLNRQQTFDWTTRPYGPFGQLNNLTGSTTSKQRAAASNSSVNTGFNAAATSISIKTPTGKLWGSTAKKPGNFPLDIMIGGERMTVSGITGTSSPQTFAISARGVNGFNAAHLVDEVVQVVDTFYAGY